MSDQIDVNQLSNALQQKVDLPSGKSQADIDYVVEWKVPTSSDPRWYRKYKSGWVEQGGSNVALNEISTATVTYLVPMANTNYTLLAVQTNQSTASDAEVGIQFTATSTTQGTLSCHYINPNTTYVSWEVKGMSAQS